VDARSAREWSSEAAARAICPNSLRWRCCISDETGGWLVCDRTDTLVTWLEGLNPTLSLGLSQPNSNLEASMLPLPHGDRLRSLASLLTVKTLYLKTPETPSVSFITVLLSLFLICLYTGLLHRNYRFHLRKSSSRTHLDA